MAEAPSLVAFLRRYRTSSALISDVLAHQRLYGRTATETADWFLRERTDIWTVWVPEAVAARVLAAIG